MAAPTNHGFREPIAYWLAILAHLWPVWTNPWFVTLDGPCHVYNSRMVLALLQGGGIAQEFLQFNHFPEPNWLGHVVMALAMTVTSANIAEKVIFTLIIGGMGWAFRELARTLAPDRVWLSWLIMPFLLTYTLRIGFINFSLGLPLLLIALGRFERFLKGEERNAIWQMGLLLLALYFAHITAFMASLAILGMRSVVLLVQHDRSSIFRSLRLLSLATVLPFMLTVAFLMGHSTVSNAGTSIPLGELLGWVRDGSAWITLTREEIIYTRPIAAGLLVITCFGLSRLRWPIISDRSPSWAFALASLSMLAAFLFLPDKMASGGVLSPRLLLFAMLLFAVFALTTSIPRWLAMGGTMLIAGADLAHLPQQAATAEVLSNEAQEILSVADQLDERSVLLPLNYGDNWMHSNFSEYVGAVSGCIVLDNIGAASPHFPLIWRPERSPHPVLGSFSLSNRPCTTFDAYRDHGHTWVTHVLTWKMNDAITDSCTNDVRRQLVTDFDLVASSPNNDARLYRRK